jgi:peptide/nickel transport system substrate-binding protein
MTHQVAVRLSAGEPVRRALRLALAPLLLAVLLPACEGRDRPDGPRRGGTLVIAGPNDLGDLNPLVTAQNFAQEFARFALFVPLVMLDSRMEYVPALARSWSFEGDSSVQFELRRDVRWHDGQLTTAHDVAFTFERAKHPETGFHNPAYFSHWDAVEVIDSFTVRFRIRPHADPLYGWYETPPIPQHLLRDVPPGQLRNAPYNRSPVGNGPYRFVSHQMNDRTVFQANPEFPQELGGPPNIERVIWRVIPENSAQETELLSGSVDMIMSGRAERIVELDRRPDIRMIVRPSPNYLFIGWNSRRPGFDDARVRRALTMAIDRQRLIDGLRAGFGEVAIGPVGPFHWAFDSALRPLPHDPEAARALLADAGWVDRNGDGFVQDESGRTLAFSLKIPAGNEFNRDVAEVVRQDLARIGVRLRTDPTEFATMVSDIVSPERRFDAVLLGLVADLRLNLRDNFHSAALDGPFQLASYRNPEVDRILDSTAVLVERDAARPLLHRLQDILQQDQPWSFLYYYPDLRLVRERIKGIEVDIRGNFVNLPRWWIGDDVPAPPEDGA